MEVLYFILQEIRNVPPWVRWISVALMFMVVLGLGHLVTPMVGLMVGAGLLGVFGAVALVLYFLKRRGDKKAAEFGGELQGSNETPGGAGDPARRSRLADLRKNFENGLERYRSTGKDLY